MISVRAIAAMTEKSPLTPFQIQRREPGPDDVLIDIHYCGICHSDLHQARNEWGGGMYPMVPGHEIVGKISKVGSQVTKFKVGDSVGVGCFVDSCRVCESCREGLEQYCDEEMTSTYNSKTKDSNLPTYGGYSQKIVVDQNYVLRLPENLPMAAAAPLLCAGITTYSPLRQWNVKRGDRVAVIGLGGLGHMAVQIAAAMGAEVTLFSTSENKRQDALDLGAKHFALSTDDRTFVRYNNHFDFILSTVAANIPLNKYLSLLKRDKTMVVVGAPEKPDSLHVFALIGGRKRLAGSLIGGIRETQEMLDFCAQHGITSKIELIKAQEINEAYERMLKGQVKYRFVIDCASL